MNDTPVSKFYYILVLMIFCFTCGTLVATGLRYYLGEPFWAWGPRLWTFCVGLMVIFCGLGLISERNSK